MTDCIVHMILDDERIVGFPVFRWRWSLLIVTGLVLISLSLLGVYLIQGALKGQCCIYFVYQ